MKVVPKLIYTLLTFILLMSADNGLLVKKNSDGFYDVYYVAGENMTLEKTFGDLYEVIRYIQESQECYILEYGTRFSGF